MNEIFKQYKDTNYYISNYGRVINAKYNHELGGKISAAGYREVVLYYNKKNHYKRVHRLVAEYFCEKKDGCDVVNHLDSNKLNNHADNLEWTTVQGNTKHWVYNSPVALEQLRERSKLGVAKRQMKLQVFKDGNYVGTYESQDSAAKSLNIDRKTIYNAMHSSMKNAKGYTFEIVKGGDADAKIE